MKHEAKNPLMSFLKLNIPIFPLPIFLLPGGVTRLRVFEPRYLRMVRVATKGDGFVVWSNNKESTNQEELWGSWVHIINFDQGNDGVLEIDVKCQSLVSIENVTAEEDNLHFGQIKELAHWSQIKTSLTSEALSLSLEKVFVEDKRLNELYAERDIDNESWVVARWLELLPLQLDVKTAFVSMNTYDAAKKFIQSIILK